MNIYVYSDESGVFDKVHNAYFVFGGLIFLSKEDRDVCARKYSAAEKNIRRAGEYSKEIELKATNLKNNEKDKLYRALNNAIKFGVVIKQREVLDRIFTSKKDKQRYLDYAYKIGLKAAFQQLINEGKIQPDQVDHICVFADEHTTATNGRYELREALEQEFKNGTYNGEYNKFYEPIFKGLNAVELTFCNSSKKILIRAADIVANKIYFKSTKEELDQIRANGVYIKILPRI